ncbi:sulfotransferase [Vibrio metschnikovii]|nr:sulfotransferase [Vibrio metschnikovii]EKO3770713.1 sulfotransferase [Vibrio metschnikovii]
MNKKVNLYIVGGQKCGTTALAYFLSQHPEICIAKGKEVHLFDNPNYQHLTDEEITKIYSDYFEHYNHEQYLCDATPIYSYRKDIPYKIKKYNPYAKVIMMVRDPIDRAISHYMMSINRKEESNSLLGAFLLESYRLMRYKNDTSWSSPLRTNSYLDRGNFITQINNIKNHIREENLLIIHHDDLKNNHQETLNLIFNFLDIEMKNINPQEIFIGKYSNINRVNLYFAKFFAKLKLHKNIKFINKYKSYKSNPNE